MRVKDTSRKRYFLVPLRLRHKTTKSSLTVLVTSDVALLCPCPFQTHIHPLPLAFFGTTSDGCILTNLRSDFLDVAHHLQLASNQRDPIADKTRCFPKHSLDKALMLQTVWFRYPFDRLGIFFNVLVLSFLAVVGRGTRWPVV